jgi:imidazolonepropionase
LASSLLLRRIKSLVGIQPAGVNVLKGDALGKIESIEDAYLFMEGNKIVSFGKDQDCKIERADEVLDCSGKLVLPPFVIVTPILYLQHGAKVNLWIVFGD